MSSNTFTHAELDYLKSQPPGEVNITISDKDGRVVYSELVPEVTSEPNYDAALAALKKLL